jgi:hypothetical protein
MTMPPRDESAIPVRRKARVGEQLEQRIHEPSPELIAFRDDGDGPPVIAWPDVTGAITFGHLHGGALAEFYALHDGRLFRVARDGEVATARYPKASKTYPQGVPLVPCRIVDA